MDPKYAEALNQGIRLLSLRHRARAAQLLAPLGLHAGQEAVLLELDRTGPLIQAQSASAGLRATQRHADDSQAGGLRPHPAYPIQPTGGHRRSTDRQRKSTADGSGSCGSSSRRRRSATCPPRR